MLQLTGRKKGWYRLIPFIENLPEWHVERSRELLHGIDMGNRVAILESGDVNAEETSAFFDVALAQVLRFAEVVSHNSSNRV